MFEPILVLSMPRTGSSMTAGIFAQHGVWAGRCRAPSSSNEKGHFENVAIRNLLIREHGRIVVKAELARPKAGFKERVLKAIAKDGYKDGPWMWKGSAMYWPAWFEFEPKIVVCRREPQAIVNSCLNSVHKSSSPSQLRIMVKQHTELLDRLVAERGAVEVDTARVANGDFATIRQAVEHCGLEFDEQRTAEFVDPTLWHYGRK